MKILNICLRKDIWIDLKHGMEIMTLMETRKAMLNTNWKVSTSQTILLWNQFYIWGEMRWIGGLRHFSTMFCYAWLSVSTAGRTIVHGSESATFRKHLTTTCHGIRTPAERGEWFQSETPKPLGYGGPTFNVCTLNLRMQWTLTSFCVALT